MATTLTQQQQPAVGAQQPAPAPTTTTQKAPTSPDPFTSLGGGVWTGSGWVPKGHPLAASAPAQPAATTPAATVPAAPTVQQQQQQTFDQQMLGMLQTNPSQVSINDPTLRPQAQAFAQAQDRARRDRQAAMAERLGAEGAESGGAMTADIAQSYQDVGNATGAFNANLVGQELQSRRDQLQKALDLYGSMLDANKARDLQMQLAQLDAAIKREGIASQNSLGQGDLALRDKLGMGQLNLGLLNALLSNDQFGKSLGFQIGSKEADLNTQALLAMMNG